MEYLKALFDAGQGLATARLVPCAVMWAQPHLGCPMRRIMPMTAAALAGWKGLQPPCSRPPLPRCVMLAVVLDCMEKKEFGYALAIALMFETYGRTSEILALTKECVVLPVRAGTGHLNQVVIQIRSGDLGVPGRTGLTDLSISLDLPRHAWLASLMKKWVAKLEPSAKLWMLTHQELSKAFHAIAARLNVSRLRPCLYSLRHGGASHDRAVLARSLQEVQQRGGWKTHESVRRYEKHGLINKELARLDRQTLEALLEQEPFVASRCVKLFEQ